LIFRLQTLRFHFLARESLHFEEGKAANTLRGALGTILRHQLCRPECALRDYGENRPAECTWAAMCPYARIFEPRRSGAGPSGLTHSARPFVLRAVHLDGQTFQAASEFHFAVHWFDLENPALPYLTAAFAELANEGLGHGRRKVELIRVDAKPLEFDLKPDSTQVSRVRLRFITPTELKGRAGLADRPEFAILAARARDRISTLRALYGGGPLPLDFRAFGQRAALIEMTRCEIEWVHRARRSARTGQVHPLGGFVGEAEYSGALTEFMPYLQLAQWTGVGRHTSWGNGMIQLCTCSGK
jgi:CRISPR-associated endoribonuclease Cas6